MSNVKVSVIIPVFNTEKYLNKCLNSLINQTLNEIEIICIDDGSTDNSLQILNEYSLKDNRIIILSQENQKQGAARNRGLDIAQGEFVTYVDSDDWVDVDYLEKLYNAAVEFGINIAAASMTRDKKHKVKPHLSLKTKVVYQGASDIVEALDNHFETAGKLYRREVIKDLRFQEGVLYEDGGYTLRAIYQCNSMVTVPDTHYHYYSNPRSTIKANLGIRQEIDKISTSLDMVNFADSHNIKMKEWCIIKEEHLLWKIKHYKERKDFYFCGIKLFSKHETFDNGKTFVIFNTACFGDVLLCNTLCQNIKSIFPESKIVFVCDKNFETVAKYQQGVDEVLVFDKKGEHKGLWGIIKFAKDFKYKKVFASVVTYNSLRNVIIAKLIRTRLILGGKNDNRIMSTQLKHAQLLKPITNKKIVNLPIKFNLPSGVKNIVDVKDYVVLCATSKKKFKDMPVETLIELINKINAKTKYKAVFTGAGELASEYSEKLHKAGCEFIDLTNKTSILELGAVLKGSRGLISVDTGTLHYGYSLGVPTTAVFYDKDYVPYWAPTPDIYDVAVIDENQSADNIFEKTMGELLNEH